MYMGIVAGCISNCQSCTSGTDCSKCYAGYVKRTSTSGTVSCEGKFSLSAVYSWDTIVIISNPINNEPEIPKRTTGNVYILN